MATRGRREAEFVVDVDVIGSDSVNKLAKDVRALAKDGGEAAPEFERLASEIEKIGAQGDAVAVLQRLQAETDELRIAAEKAAATESELAAKLGVAAQAVERADAAYREAVANQQNLTQQRNAAARALAELRNETDKAGRSEASFLAQQRNLRATIIDLNGQIEQALQTRRQAKDAVREATAAENGYTTQLNRLAAETTKSNTAFRDRAAALADAQVAAGRLGVDTQNLAAEQVRLAQSLQGATSSVQRLSAEQEQLAADEEASAYAAQQFAEAVRRADVAMAEQVATLAKTEAAMERYTAAQIEAASAGDRDVAANERRLAAAQELIRTDNLLSAAQRELANARNVERAATLQQAQAQDQAAQKARESLAATQQMVAAARSAATVLSDAFGKTGVRSLQAIETEIHETEAALSTLERKFKAGAISARDLERATAGANLRLQQLQAEINSQPTAPGVFERMNASITSLANRFGALSAAAATFGFAVRPVIQAQIELERLNRVLTTVTGSSDRTAKTIQFLRDVAQESGQSFTAMSESFSKFAASAVNAGIPLETVESVFRSAANAAGNLGLSTEATGRILNALGQIASKGTVQMEELKGQLGESLPGALSLTAKSLGLTTQELTKLIESGGLTANVAIPAIGRAMDELASKSGRVDGLAASWNRVTNMVRESGTEFTSGPLGRGLGAVLNLAGEGLERLNTRSRQLLTALTSFGAGVGASISAVVNGDFKNLGQALEDITKGAVTKIQELENGLDKTQKAAAAAAPAIGTVRTNLEATAAAAAATSTSFATNVNAINTTVEAANRLTTAQKSAAESINLAATNAQTATASWARAAVDYKLATDAATVAAQVADRLAQAKRTEGEAMVAVAELAGNEIALQQARATAASNTAAALQVQADADRALVAVYESERDALTLLIEKTGMIDAGQEQRLKILNELIAAKTADAEKTIQQAAAADRQAAALQASSLALVDNSKNLAEFSKAATAAREEYLSVSKAFAEGKATAEDLSKAHLNLAKTMAAVKDATLDAVTAAKQKIQTTQIEAQITLAALDVQRQSLQVEIQILESQGRTYEATQKKIALKELEIKIIKATIEAKLAEVKATQAEIEAERQALEVTGQLTEAKRLELDARLKALEVKKLEAEAAKQNIKLLEEQISNLRNYGSEAVKTYDSITESIGRQTEAVETNTEAWKKNAAERRRVDDEGWAVDSAGNRVNMQVPDAQYVNSQLQAKGIDPAIARREGFIGQNGEINLRGFSSLEAVLAHLAAKYANSSSLLVSEDRYNGMDTSGGLIGIPQGESPPKQLGSSAKTATTKTIVIDRGRNYSIDTTAEGARNLESLLKGLGAASDRSAS